MDFESLEPSGGEQIFDILPWLVAEMTTAMDGDNDEDHFLSSPVLDCEWLLRSKLVFVLLMLRPPDGQGWTQWPSELYAAN